MRYRGQGHEIAVPLTGGALDPAMLRTAFDEAYARLFGRTIPRLEVEALTWTLALSEPQDLPAFVPSLSPRLRRPQPLPAIDGLIESASGETVQAAVFERDALTTGAINHRTRRHCRGRHHHDRPHRVHRLRVSPPATWCWKERAHER